MTDYELFYNERVEARKSDKVWPRSKRRSDQSSRTDTKRETEVLHVAGEQ